MATQYTSILKLALPVQGELSGTWGTAVNEQVTSMVEEAIAGLKTINTWVGNSATLSTADGATSESRAAILNLTDTTSDLSGAATLLCPAASKVYIVKNATGQAVTVKPDGASGITIPDGTTGFVYCDGTNVLEAITNVAGNMTIGGNLTVTGTLDLTDSNFSNVGSIALDSITNDGTDITLDSSNDIVIDAAGGNIEFKDDGTLQLVIDMDGTAGAQVVKLGVDSDDLIFQQYDGNEVVRIADDRKLYFFDKGGEHISSDGTDFTLASGNDINLTATTDINVPANVGLTFGNDAEKIEGDGTDLTISGNNINLTAVADVIVPANVGVTFGTGEKIEGDNTDLTVTSGGAINLTATTDVVVPANVGVTFGTGEKIEGDSTDLTVTSGGAINLTATSDVVVPANVGVTFGTGEKIEGDNTDLTITSGAKINLTATSDVHIPNNVGVVFGGDSEKIEGDGTDMTISANNLTVDAVADITLDAGGANIVFKADGTSILDIANNSGDVELTVSTADKNFAIKGTDGSSAITALDIDMALAGKATFSGDVVVTGDLTISGDDLTMGTNTADMLLIADGTNFNPTAISSLSSISTVANDDVFLAIDTSGGGLKQVTRSTIVSGLAVGGVALSNVVEDTTPQLGGDLDAQGKDLEDVGISSADAHAGIYGSSSSPVEFTVTVGSKTSAHPYHGDGSSNAYFINGVESPALTLHGVDNVTSNSEYYYRFTLSSSDMSSHPFRLYLDADKTTAYTTGVTTTSTYLQIAVNEDTPNILYYQCSSHAYMGNHAIVLGSNKINHSEALISFPTATTTLVGTGTTDTLTNKTFGDNVSFGDNNITNVGDIALDSISADGNDINIAVTDNRATGFTIKQGSDAYLIVDTANSSESVSIGTGISGTAITLGHSTSEVTVADNLTVTGDLTVNGATTTVDTTNLAVKDTLLGLNQGASSNSNDVGIIIERGSTGNDALFMWDESADKFALGTTTDNASSTGNLNMTTGTLVANIEGNVTGDLTGTASTATVATTVTISDNESTNEDNAIIFTSGGDVDGGNIGLESDGTLTYNPSTGKITATGFIGALTGNSDTATVATTVTITDNESTNEDNAIIFTAGGDVDGGNIGLESDGTLTYNPSTGKITATGFIGALTGNADTATVATTVTITDNESTNEDNAIIFTAGGDVDGGNIGLESDGTLTYNPSTGKITATGFIGALTGNADTATVATTVTITDNENTNEDNAIIFTAGGDVDGGNIGLESDGDLTYNPSTGNLTATKLTTTGNIELGHASATTLSGSSGVLSVEGNAVLTTATGATKGFATAMAIAL